MVSGLADSSVTRVVIPETVTFGGVAYSVDSIGDFAFRDCSKLTSVTIPDRVVNIGYMAFASCTGLTSILLPIF
ncbi:MAG: leucine-rich repeat domain-containing protein [Bacteroidales bacterium]|nr:leucine-rich repeat domain-containing protein [Bacteroidales bacterium]